ncbi:MAG: hypothetical protein NTU83_15090 [Candidatus Hydrogenedentes bacterium]|nr:hypothetical protein [Candidatus Hydrogenedentota bacterium]
MFLYKAHQMLGKPVGVRAHQAARKVVVDFGGEFFRGLVAVFGASLHGTFAYSGQFRGHVLLDLADGRGRRIHNVLQKFVGGHAQIGQPSGENRVKHCAQRIDVRPLIDLVDQSLRLFGGHEMGRTHGLPIDGLG